MSTDPTVYDVYKYVKDNRHMLKLLFNVIYYYYGLLIAYQVYTICLIAWGKIRNYSLVQTGFPDDIESLAFKFLILGTLLNIIDFIIMWRLWSALKGLHY